MRKAILLVIIFACSIFDTLSQTITASSYDTTLVGDAGEGDIFGHVRIYNNGTQPLFMKWIRFDVNVPSGWLTSVCDPDNCLLPHFDSSNFVLGINVPNNHINVHFLPDGIAGTGSFKIKVFEDADPSNGIVLKFNAIVTPLGQEHTNSTRRVLMYPNPVTDKINIQSSPGVFDNLSQYFIYNFLGQKATSGLFYGSSGINVIDVGFLPKGSYILKTDATDVAPYHFIKL
jgi:hypothetical protein